jgi:hypothetical protein
MTRSEAIHDSARRSNDVVVDYAQYMQRITSLNLDYGLASEAIRSCLATDAALEVYADRILAIARGLAGDVARNVGIELGENVPFSGKDAERQFKQGVKQQAFERLPAFESRMWQSTYVMQVALFEGFMKDVLRAVLTAEPALLQPDRKIDLGKLVATGFDETLKAEVERQVATIDRQSVETRERYFRDHLGLDWFGGKITPLLSSVTALRNEILHVDADRMVTQGETNAMNLVTVSLPLLTVHEASARYPKHFAPTHAGTEQRIESYRMDIELAAKAK